MKVRFTFQFQDIKVIPRLIMKKYISEAIALPDRKRIENVQSISQSLHFGNESVIISTFTIFFQDNEINGWFSHAYIHLSIILLKKFFSSIWSIKIPNTFSLGYRSYTKIEIPNQPALLPEPLTWEIAREISSVMLNLAAECENSVVTSEYSAKMVSPLNVLHLMQVSNFFDWYQCQSDQLGACPFIGLLICGYSPIWAEKKL